MPRSPVVTLNDLDLSPQSYGTRFHAAMAAIAARRAGVLNRP